MQASDEHGWCLSVTHEHNLRILTAEYGSFPWFSQVLPAEWRNVRMAEWRNGGVGEWWNGGMAEWRNGRMAEWRNGGTAEWRNGGMANGMAEWQNGRRNDLPSLVLTSLFPPV